MTKQQIQDAIGDLLEVRREISRINFAAGQTIFNPAVKIVLEEVIDQLAESIGE